MRFSNNSPPSRLWWRTICAAYGFVLSFSSVAFVQATKGDSWQSVPDVTLILTSTAALVGFFSGSTVQERLRRNDGPDRNLEAIVLLLVLIGLLVFLFPAFQGVRE